MKMKTHRRKNKNPIIILIIGIIIVFFITMSFILKDGRKLTFVEKIVKDSSLFINKMVMYPITLFETNKSKSLEESIINKNTSELDNLKKELEELKDVLKLNSLNSDYDSINATIINRNIGYWYEEVIIDKGSNSGIKENMAVVMMDGLIGKTVKVTKNTSTIKLLTSDNKVSVQIKTNDEYVYGILTKFDRKNGYYIVEGVSNLDKINEKMLVSTTGMGDVFPSGILIGEVVSIDKDNFEIDAKIKVKPSINVDNFNYVTVLRRKQ